MRSIPALKIFLISYVWAAMSTFLPSMIEGTPIFSGTNITVFIANALFIISITLPFDIRDFASDSEQSIITIPQLIDVLPTKILAIICLISFWIVIKPFVNDIYLTTMVLITGVLIYLSGKKRRNFYYSFYIDGTIILYFIVVLLSFK